MAFKDRLAVVAIACGALVFASPADAHLSINPDKVRTNQLVDLVFSVPNVGDAIGIDHVTLGIPQDFDLDDLEAKPGWTQSRTGQAVTWSGGLIAKGTFARFAIRGTAPPKPETVLFNVLVGDRRGKSITYRVALDVTRRRIDLLVDEAELARRREEAASRPATGAPTASLRSPAAAWRSAGER